MTIEPLRMYIIRLVCVKNYWELEIRYFYFPYRKVYMYDTESDKNIFIFEHRTFLYFIYYILYYFLDFWEFPFLDYNETLLTDHFEYVKYVYTKIEIFVIIFQLPLLH